MPGALDGILVLDLTRILAGPYCTMILGDLGARVIKIEKPGTGDETRQWGPPFIAGESAYFLSVNRNKESVTLNLKHPEGREILWKLIEKADVLVENFRPGEFDRMGFSYEACSERFPRLIYASISGYGKTGPESHRLGYDLIAQAEGGVMSLTGEPGGPPLKAGVSQADIVAGIWTISAILAALYVRERTGRGQQIDTALLDGQVGLLGYHAVNYFATGKVPARMGNKHSTITPYEMYEASDGFIVVAIGSNAQFAEFFRILGRGDLVDDPRFANNAQRIAHRKELDAIVAKEVARDSVGMWLTKLENAGVPAGKVRNVAEVLNSRQVLEREMLVEVEHPTAGVIKLTGTPVKLSHTRPSVRSTVPRHGEHSQQVLSEFVGVTASELLELGRRGVT